MRARTAAAVVVMATTAFMTGAGPASAWVAKDWAKSTTPLQAVEGGVIQGQGYGTWNIAQLSNGTRSVFRGRMIDNKAGGEGIFYSAQTWTNAGYCAAPEYVQCEASYYPYTGTESPRYYQNVWSGAYQKDTALNPSADYARGHVQVCEDHSWSTDACSGWAYSANQTY